MVKRLIIFVSTILIIPFFALASENNKEIRVFDFQGQLLSIVELQDFYWNKVGDMVVADLGTDGTPEIIISAAAGAKPYIKIFRLDGSLINQFLVYPEAYLGGINLAVADLDKNGVNEIITGATAGGGPHVLVLNNQGKVLSSFFAFDKADKGGVNIAAGNLYNDSLPEIIVSSNSRNSIKIFDRQGSFLNQIDLQNSFEHGQRIKAADLGTDGVAEILVFPNKNDLAGLYLYRNNGEYIASYSFYDQNFKGGINLDTDGGLIYFGAGFGNGPYLRIIDGFNNIKIQFSANEEDFLGGVIPSVYQNKIYTIPQQFPSASKPDDHYISIDLSEQMLRYFENGFLLDENSISSGKTNYPTPVGEFSVLKKSKLQFSKKYGLYMPFWMEFYPGFGIHELPYWPNGYREGQSHLGTPVSHGCVRLGIGPAEKLFSWAAIGTKIYIEK